jgi:chorismate mutase
MYTRGIRGATTVQSDQPTLILERTQELLMAIMHANEDLKCGDIASVIFTLTDDLLSVHPALAARQMGWDFVPMLCVNELPVPGSLPRCIRVLIEWNTDTMQKDIRHVYLHDAVALRPDLMAS